MYFHGSTSNQLYIPTGSDVTNILRSVASASIFGVGNCIADSETNGIFGIERNSAAEFRAAIIFNTSEALLAIVRTNDSSTSISVTGPTAAATPRLYGATFDWANGACYVYSNQVVVASNTGLSKQNTPNTGSVGIRIGRYSNVYNALHGSLGCIVVTVPALSAEDVTNLWIWAQSKYNL